MLNLQSIYFGQKHPQFDYKDYDTIRKISRLAHKHHKQCENDCNGEGWIKSKFYRCDNKEGYLEDGETTVFSAEAMKLENRIAMIMDKLNQSKYALWRVKPFKVEFQGDPRGNTVKLYYEGDFIEL